MIGTAFTGALGSMAIALVLMAFQSSSDWSRDPHSENVSYNAYPDWETQEIEESACDDYRPVPPADGAWCGIVLDDRNPLREDSFPSRVVLTPDDETDDEIYP